MSSRAFLARRPDDDHYVIEYVDYAASSDGHFRKFRFVGEEVLPYHLAIGNDRKVHHVSTDMANQPRMQQEEAAFLGNPAAIFNAAHYQALRVVRERFGLDYFGIDCGLDPDGRTPNAKSSPVGQWWHRTETTRSHSRLLLAPPGRRHPVKADNPRSGGRQRQLALRDGAGLTP